MARNLHLIRFPQEGLRSGTNPWRATRTQVVNALQQHGCFMAEYEKLSSLRDSLFGQLPEIFAQCPQYESFDIPKATTEKGIKKFITDLSLQGNNDMREAILNFTRTAEMLEEMVRMMVFEHYGRVNLPRESSGCTFRMMKCREVRLGCSAQEFLAVLDLNQVNGLEMTTDGQRFPIGLRASTFLIMAGNPLMEWSNGEINPPELRMNEEKPKYLVGLFA